MMKLICIGNYFSDAQHSQSIWQDLVFHLRQEGYFVITASGKNNKILRLLDMLSTIWDKKNDYQIAQIDIFSGHAFIWALLSVKLLRLINKPIILTLHGGNLPAFSIHHKNQIRWLLSQANTVTVPSRYLLDTMQSYRKDLILIPNGLDIKRYCYVQRVSPRPILIWLRSFHKIYHPELAIEVLFRLHKEFPTLRLVMVGPDKGDGSLQKTQNLAIKLGLEDFVEFPGAIPKNEVQTWLNRGDIFINTTNFDNTPISVMEAMACGLCVVSTNVGGIPYLIAEGKDGLLVPPNDPELFSKEIVRLLTEPGLAESISINSRKKIELFDWSLILPKWKELFDSIL